jgi:carbon monoxide dehydrogenase subunit G
VPVFEESFRVDASPPAVWRVLDDPTRLAACVPGCEEVVAEGADRFRVRLRVKVGPISTTQRFQLTVTERRSPVRLAATGQGEDQSLASRVSLRTAIDLREAAGGVATDVSCRVELQLTGRLATLGEAVMRAKSAQMVRAFAERLAAAAGEPVATAPTPAGDRPGRG